MPFIDEHYCIAERLHLVKKCTACPRITALDGRIVDMGEINGNSCLGYAIRFILRGITFPTLPERTQRTTCAGAPSMTYRGWSVISSPCPGTRSGSRVKRRRPCGTGAAASVMLSFGSWSCARSLSTIPPLWILPDDVVGPFAVYGPGEFAHGPLYHEDGIVVVVVIVVVVL